MRKIITYSFIIILTLTATSKGLCHKDLIEYGKWLKFYNLNHEDFQKVGNDSKLKITWSDYDLTEKCTDIYKTFYIYSTDSTYFIDLDSYSLAIENRNNKLISYGSGIDMKVQIIRLSDNKSATLLFCGSSCIPETANWITDSWIEIVGFSDNESGKMKPTKWKFDLENMVFATYQIDINIDSISDFYYEKERLKSIEFIKNNAP
ncbi:hypothetical protein [Marinifilum caeruleilacunae]|uniref:Carbohydrate-binding domain-containing protein n=1 Tax=Marinifilum caeruleilacunae TaxID=2499076 RepID=A0ABX1X1Y9_9BACT|nr:hypothetical protein [Marinifilum caeruleilacunae]NOU62377.1 hypothetical protein [Marinifilum caeruleilacunae]